MRFNKRYVSPPVDNRIKEIMKDFGKVVRRARLKRNLSTRELADRLLLKQPWISNLENGKEKLTLNSVLDISEKLGIDVKVKFTIKRNNQVQENPHNEERPVSTES